MWQKSCSATSINNSWHSLRNKSEEKMSHLHLDRSPIPCTVIYNLTLLVPQGLPNRIFVSLLTYRIINELFKPKLVQFGAVKCVARLAFFMWVKQKITIPLIRFVAFFCKFQTLWQVPKRTVKLSWRVAYHLKLHSTRISQCVTADTICVPRCQCFDATTFPGKKIEVC
jgi:hypothetical protein